MTSLIGGHISVLPSTPWATALGLNEPLAVTLLDLAQTADIIPTPQLGEILGVAELERYHGFRYPKRRQEWLGGRLAAKAAVTQLLTASGTEPPAPAALVIAADRSGKPLLALPGLGLSVHLSITHSHGRAAALAGHHPCGIDLQYATPTVVRVRERFATTEEERILAAALGRRVEILRLTLLWAAKEAIRKMAPIRPLPAFHDTVLSAVQPAGAEYLFLFSAPKICHNAPLRVVAAMRDDYALAVSVLPPTD